MRTQSTRIKDKPVVFSFFDRKKLLLFSMMSFITAFFIFRLFSAIQRAGIIEGGPNIIGDLHLHHWAIAILVMPFVIVIAFIYRTNKNVWGFLMIFMSFLVGMFVDGIVYYDSAIFFEQNTMELQPVTMSDIWFLTFLGIVWIALIFTILTLQINEVQENLKRHRR